MKKWIIRTFGLKGSWSWAKRQMMKGKMVKCRHWHGSLILRIDNPANTLLQFVLARTKAEAREHKWQTSNHFLCYEDFIDYYVFNFES